MDRAKRLDIILEEFQKVARAEILKDFKQDSCIGSTRVAIRVLDYFDFHATPFPCIATVFNSKMVDCVERGELPEGQVPREWFEKTGSWSVGLGIAKDGNEDPVGHLVAVMPNQRILVDASLDQASRPEHDIVLPSVFIARCSKRFVECAQPQVYQADPGHGSLIYTPKPYLRRYLESDNWNLDHQTDRAVQTIVNLIGRKL
jgi:hypothetical protein